MDQLAIYIDKLAIYIDELSELDQYQQCDLSPSERVSIRTLLKQMLKDFSILTKNESKLTQNESDSKTVNIDTSDDIARKVALREMYGLPPHI